MKCGTSSGQRKPHRPKSVHVSFPKENVLTYVRQSGLSLVQLIVAISVGLILLVLTAFLIAPNVRRAGIETEVRQDLQAFVTAMNIYRTENDGLFPHFMLTSTRPERIRETLPGAPVRPPQSVFDTRDPRFPPFYNVSINQRLLNLEESQGRMVRWNAETDMLVGLKFWFRRDAERVASLNLPFAKPNWQVNGFELRPTLRKQRQIMAATLSGKIGWRWFPDEYFISQTTYNTYLGY